MSKTESTPPSGRTLLGTVASLLLLTLLPPSPRLAFVSPVAASQAGDACRKEICEGAVAECVQANQQLNPLAANQDEKNAYCRTFYLGCMTRTIVANQPWYSPETVKRFMKCPA